MLKLSKAAQMVEEWVEMLSGYCEIIQVEKTTPDNSYRFLVYEDDYDPITLIVTETGKLINQFDEDIIEGFENAYDNNSEMLRLVREFKEKWKEEVA